MKVLIVDDKSPDRSILRLIFSAHGCETVEAENGREGLVMALEHKPDLIISDALMPVLDGFGFLREIKADKILGKIPFIFYSAVYTGHEEEKLARSQGAEAFLVKPMEPERLWSEVQTLLKRLETGEKVFEPAVSSEEEQYLKEYSHVVVGKLEEKVRELEEMFLQVVKVLVNLLDAKSPWTMGHSERVAEIAVNIAKGMCLDENIIKTVHLGALLHDIGKIGTYDTLLDKMTPLTKDEYSIIKGHPDRGADALAAIDQLKDIIPLIRYHHEHFDGTGYPRQLGHDDIPLAARIISVADAYDSMTVTRPYRLALGSERAMEELRRCAGSQLDPEVVQACIKVMEHETANKDIFKKDS
jgi:putative nucleotidyltransferase with HDIG domain